MEMEMEKEYSQKIDWIKDNQESVLAAFEATIDRMYNLINSVLNEDFTINEDLVEKIEDEQTKKFTKELIEDIQKYDSVRKKIANENYDLTLKEINYVGLQFFYVMKVWENQILQLKQAMEEAGEAIKILMGNDESNS